MDKAPSPDTKKTSSKDLLYVQPNRINKDLFITNNRKISKPASQSTFKIEQSSILDRVKCFLPKMATANDELSKISPEEKENINIENVLDEDKVIEMNIAMVDPDVLLSDNENDGSDSSDSSDDETEEPKENIKIFSDSATTNKKVIIEEVMT